MELYFEILKFRYMTESVIQPKNFHGYFCILDIIVV